MTTGVPDAPDDHADSEDAGGTSTALSRAADAAGHLLAGATIPAPLRKNAFRAFNQLCSAAIDIPVAYLEGVATEKRAETQARVKLISTGADQIAAQMNVAPAFAAAAVKKFAERIVREQVNLQEVSEAAARELSVAPEVHSDADSEPAMIDDDWLNNFEKEASQKSTQEMQQLFGKILAEEIRKPSTFSLKTVKLLGQLDRHTARLFRKLCSIAVSLRTPTTLHDARAVSLRGNAAANSLLEYGLGFEQLNTLHEYGLIIPDYNSWLDYKGSIAHDNQVALPFTYQNAEWALIPSTEHTPHGSLRLHGVSFSRAGRELLRIVEVEPDDRYTTALEEYFEKLKFTMRRVGT